MRLRKKWIWETYFFLVLFYTLRDAYFFFSPGSPIHLYFYILYVFDFRFAFIYSLNLVQILLSLTQCLALAFYVYRIRFLKPYVWQYTFILKIIFDLFGHSYQVNELKSFYYDNPKICLLFLLQSLILYLPSYVACYRYAFRQKNLFCDGKN